MYYSFKLPTGRVINFFNAEHDQLRHNKSMFNPKVNKGNDPGDSWSMNFYTPIAQEHIEFKSESAAKAFWKDLEDLEAKLNKKILKELGREDKA